MNCFGDRLATKTFYGEVIPGNAFHDALYIPQVTSSNLPTLIFLNMAIGRPDQKIHSSKPNRRDCYECNVTNPKQSQLDEE